MKPEAVLDAKEFLASLGAWPPIPAEANPRKWLDGFDNHHQPHALAILDSLIYISTKQVRKMFESGIHTLSGEVSSTAETYQEKKHAWNAFLHNAIFSMPTGEKPSPADSGFAFMRMARDVLNVGEDRLAFPNDLRDRLAVAAPESPLIFIDDFVGSGEQFTETWTRQMWDEYPRSVEELVSQSQTPVYYVPLVATQFAVDRLINEAPNVHLRPSHVLAEEYSILHPKSVMLPEELRAGARDFLEEASANAGIVNDYILGFYDLALGFAFEESIPDASVALYWSKEGSWHPLIPRPQ